MIHNHPFYNEYKSIRQQRLDYEARVEAWLLRGLGFVFGWCWGLVGVLSVFA